MGATPAVAGRDRCGPGALTQRVYLHIGEPKTGTTFLQDALWANRRRLAAQGVQLPGYSERDHSRASRDLRQTIRPADDPADPWYGEWDVLAGQALRVPGHAVISNELLVAATPEQAERAVRSLLAADLHVVATVRDPAAVLPAEWQEAVKCRETIGWDEWFGNVAAAESEPRRREKSWFWRVHDTIANLAMWGELLSPDRVHVITVPQGRPRELLWARFASVTGLTPDGCDLVSARHNNSLGIAETEFLRRMNQELPADVPDWFYIREIKQIVAQGVLSGQPQRSPRLSLTPAERSWAAQRAERVITGLREAGYHIVGDLAELRPPTRPSEADGSANAAADRPANAAGALQLEAAVRAAAALGARCYQLRYQPDRQPRGPRTARQLASDIKWVTLNGRRVRKVLRYASRHAVVRRVRVAIWAILMHPGRVGSPGQAGSPGLPPAEPASPAAPVPQIPIMLPEQVARHRDGSGVPPA